MTILIPYPYTCELFENSQTNNIKFTFVSPTQNKNEYKALHPWVKCREYFNEFLMQNWHPTEFQFQPTYGFKYLHKDYPYDLSKTRIALKFPSIKSKNTFLNNLQLIWDIESHNKLQQTTVSPITNLKTTKVLLIESDSFWNTSCIAMNIFTLVLKLCALDIPTKSISEVNALPWDERPSELQYVNTLEVEKINKILSNVTQFGNLPTKYCDGSNELRSCGTVHAYSGILAMNTSRYAPELQPLKDIYQAIQKQSTPFIQFLRKHHE